VSYSALQYLLDDRACTLGTGASEFLWAMPCGTCHMAGFGMGHAKGWSSTPELGVPGLDRRSAAGPEG